MNKKGAKDGVGMFAIIAIAAIVLFATGVIKLPAASTTTTTGQTGQTGQINCQGSDPSYTFQGWDALGGMVIAGTNQLKINGNAPVTSGNPVAGLPYEFWINNASTFCEKNADVGACGTQMKQVNCYVNGTSVSLKAYDVANAQFLTASGGANNLTIGANQAVNARIDFQGTAKKPTMPFGGCIAIEYPATITSVSVNGLGIVAGCPYQWTYTTAATTGTYRLFTVPNGFDKDALSDIKSFSIQFQAGSSDPSGLFYVTLAPANYYTAKDGNIYLDIEKARNSDTTKTFGISAVGTWKIE